MHPRMTHHHPQPTRSSASSQLRRPNFSYVVGLLLFFVALLVGGSLGLVRGALLVVEGLPALTENLADLTEGDARVLLTDVLALLIGEEHVGRETTLGSVRVLLAAPLGLLGAALGSRCLRHLE
jgi:hypothetical protein